MRRRAFTLVELMVVVAIGAVGASLGVASMASMTKAARVASQLAIVDLEVREARALALERRVAFFVEPDIRGIIISQGTCADPDNCTPNATGARAIALPDLDPTGDTLAFNTDGRPPLSAAKTLDLGDGHLLELGGSGTYRWTGAGELDARVDGKVEIRLSAQEVAKQ